ncbi:hypothetical protein [Bacillus sp. B-jedd]|uniref:hypothetical protein n=1 Tax=Bacillus sp. B-jedd TaxID=1476857 RepID=UPI0005155421|nr:hypothetical protein [Bacillus sp. B-jedd]CEG28328.1 hypothetical protein BN1002_03238 [Bacillus sp. B-jedd]
MYELKLRNILRQVKSPDPQKRFEGLDKLFEYKQIPNLEVQIDVLRDIIITAAGRFPEPVDSWDNPSYYLIDFVCDFPMEEVVVTLMKHFDSLSLQAKERAIEFLLGTEDEEIFFFLEEKIAGLINETDNFLIPIGELSSYPVLARDILNQTLERIHSPHYKFMLYDLILGVNSSELEQGYNKGKILPLLLEDYRETKDQYLKFNEDYTTKYAYTAWKENYFYIRSRMRLFISLMKYYFDEETKTELLAAMAFRDPLINTEAVLVCLSKNLPIDEAVIEECARHIESAEMVYWELKDMNLEHMYPIKEGKQPHLARTRLFNTIVNLPDDEDGSSHFPEDIEIIDKIETENYYGQPVRHYLMKFTELDYSYAAWVGAYALEDGDDTAYLWDGSYSDFIEFSSLTIEGHKEAFFKKREEEKAMHEQSVYYESKARVSKGMWFFYGLLIVHWLRMALDGFPSPLWPSFLFTILGAILTVVELNKIKTKSISIVGQNLVLEDGKQRKAVPLHEVRRIEHTKKHIIVYGNGKEAVMKFPLAWVRYEVFYHNIKEQTHHLKQPPYIQP